MCLWHVVQMLENCSVYLSTALTLEIVIYSVYLIYSACFHATDIVKVSQSATKKTRDMRLSFFKEGGLEGGW